MRIVADIIEYTARHCRFNSISISGYHMERRGRPRQELRFHPRRWSRLCAGGLSRGLAIDDFAPRLSFFSASA
jgi:methylmalonyl-CoA mutase N-terminal domain/subunit